jgi:Zn-dependent peptidase ImmA (M78 family)/transcriptional regulator with XRE-family HTH domain
MATDLAPVTPEVLRWARESVGATVGDAAQRAGVTEDRIQAWEAGEAEPTVAKLRALAKLYQRSLAVFFLPEPPRTFDTMRDFRRLPGGTADDRWSRPLHKVYRRALDQQEIVDELGDDDDDGTAPINLLSSAVDTPAEQAASLAREALGVSLVQQFAWRKPEESFNGWLAAVEALGVLVLRTSAVAPAEMRGFSISSGPIPVIVVNALDWPRGQVFTLLHEFAHLMLREGGLCDLLEPTSSDAKRVEAWCNAVAAAILMPADAFLDNEVVGPAGAREWEDEELAQLSGRWGASQEAVLRRLVTLKRATMEFYLRKREEYLGAYAESREIERERRRESKGGPPPYRMTVRDRGKPYVRMVLDAYQRDVITPSTLANLLGLKLKYLRELEQEVRE